MEQGAADWANFFVAAAGAAGALAGLVFVALSINLARILQTPGLAGRAGETILILAAALFGALLALVPARSLSWVGGAALVVWFPAWIVPLWIQVRDIVRNEYYRLNLAILRLVLHQTATVPFLVAAILLCNGHAIGMSWFAGALALSMAVALFNAWVLLVEIMR
jgi:hypothetical protein